MQRFIVLSGGGTSGILAHAAALDQLCQLGVDVRSIGGASAGAVIAATYASDPTRSLLPVAERLLVRARPMTERDITIYPPSYYANQPVLREFRALMPERMGQVRVPLKLVTANLELRQQRVWDSEIDENALLAPRVLASMSVPGLFPPVRLDQQFHVDGGLTSNVPALDLYGDHAGVLVLRIVRSGAPEPVTSITSYIAAMIETMIKHSESADMALLERVQVIELPITGPTVDFTVPASRAAHIAETARARVDAWWSVGRGEAR